MKKLQKYAVQYALKNRLPVILNGLKIEFPFSESDIADQLSGDIVALCKDFKLRTDMVANLFSELTTEYPLQVFGESRAVYIECDKGQLANPEKIYGEIAKYMQYLTPDYEAFYMLTKRKAKFMFNTPVQTKLPPLEKCKTQKPTRKKRAPKPKPEYVIPEVLERVQYDATQAEKFAAEANLTTRARMLVQYLVPGVVNAPFSDKQKNARRLKFTLNDSQMRTLVTYDLVPALQSIGVPAIEAKLYPDNVQRPSAQRDWYVIRYALEPTETKPRPSDKFPFSQAMYDAKHKPEN